jgi:hypothetical protein
MRGAGLTMRLLLNLLHQKRPIEACGQLRSLETEQLETGAVGSRTQNADKEKGAKGGGGGGFSGTNAVARAVFWSFEDQFTKKQYLDE